VERIRELDKKKAGVDAYNAMFTRCKIIGERINARHVAN